MTRFDRFRSGSRLALRFFALLLACLPLAAALPARAVILWSHPAAIFVRDNGAGEDILHGAIPPQDTNSSRTLYFRFRVDPISDTPTKSIADFEAGFIFFAKGKEHLGMGNSLSAWAYCAMNVPKNPKGYQDLNSATPEPPFRWEYIRAGTPRYLAFKVQYVPGHDAHITAWLNPDLSSGATEIKQPGNLITEFEADATFDEIHLVHRGSNGGGWTFSRMVIGTSFEDLLLPHFWQQRWFMGVTLGGLIFAGALAVYLSERRRTQRQIHRLEWERVVATERARIAQDIHDQVGTNLTKISKLTELMDLPDEQGRAHADSKHAIAATARDTIRAMDEIVWAINPRNDTLKEMADYLVYSTEDFLGSTGIACHLEVPLNLPDIPMTADVRHNLFMAAKEALNNAVKHAGATQINLRLTLTDGQLAITIADNGRGFDAKKAVGVGNGLENMQKRMHAIGGQLHLESRPGFGASVKLQTPLMNTKIAA